MNNYDYQTKWERDELKKFKAEDFRGLSVNDSAIDFLTTIGLPDSAAPCFIV